MQNHEQMICTAFLHFLNDLSLYIPSSVVKATLKLKSIKSKSCNNKRYCFSRLRLLYISWILLDISLLVKFFRDCILDMIVIGKDKLYLAKKEYMVIYSL